MATPRFAWKSLLFVPADNDKLLLKAPGSAAHAIILDLEDGVGGAQKASARANIAGAISTLKAAGKGVVVRVNSDQPDFLEDLHHAPLWLADAVMLPKTETGAQLNSVAEMLLECAGAAGYDGPQPGLIALIESASGMADLQVIARHPALIGAALGTEDYCLDFGVEPTPDMLRMPCGMLALQARANGLMAIATPYSIADFSDLDQYKEACQLARRLGCTGALCIHPKQVERVNSVFRPSEAELENAKAIVQAWEAAQAEGRAVLSLGGRMIDQPVAMSAYQVLKQAEE